MILTHGANSLPRGGGGMTVNIGGRKYPIVQIGNQLWLAENLDFKFSGLLINSIEYDFTIPAAWYYDRDEATYGINGTYKCGLLYNWYAVKYLNNDRLSLLPDGWHVPTDAEWTTLKNAAGNNPATKLKALDNSVISGFPRMWNGTDDYEFGVLPAGRCTGSTFNSFNQYAYFATSSEYDNDSCYFKFFDSTPSVSGNYNPKHYGYPVRLVKGA